MKRRMPFPVPLLPMMLIAMLAALIIPYFAKTWKERNGQAPNRKTEYNTGTRQEIDPFSGAANQATSNEKQIKIQTKYVSRILSPKE